jgi:hypothetical protein
MERSNVLLMDFNKDPWLAINLVNIPNIIFHLNLKAKDCRLIGGLFNDSYNKDYSLSDAAFLIKDLKYQNNCIIGTISFLQTEIGKNLCEMYEYLNYRMLCNIFYNGKQNIIENIYTWNIEI